MFMSGAVLNTGVSSRNRCFLFSNVDAHPDHITGQKDTSSHG